MAEKQEQEQQAAHLGDSSPGSRGSRGRDHAVCKEWVHCWRTDGRLDQLEGCGVDGRAADRADRLGNDARTVRAVGLAGGGLVDQAEPPPAEAHLVVAVEAVQLEHAAVLRGRRAGQALHAHAAVGGRGVMVGKELLRSLGHREDHWLGLRTELGRQRTQAVQQRLELAIVESLHLCRPEGHRLAAAAVLCRVARA